MKPGVRKNLNLRKFKKLAMQGLNCKQIAKEMGIHAHTFGFRMKEILGEYPSIYIYRIKHGKT